MSGSAENAYRITVSAQVKDNSGGTAYAFAVPAGAIANESDILQKIKANQLPETKMFPLQTADGGTTFGPEFTTLTGNVESFVNWDNLALANEALLNYDGPAGVVGSYDVYIYAIDNFKNRAVQKHPLSPIKMTSETITIAEITDLFIGDAGTIEFAEHRNLDVADPTLTPSGPLFDFHNAGGARTDQLYLMEPVLDKSEFVVNTVKVVALKAPGSDLQAVATFVNEGFGTLVESFGPEAPETRIPKVFDSVSDTTGRDLTIGEEYKVYSVIRNHGLNKDHVRLIQTVNAGTLPDITGATAVIKEI